MWGVGDEINFKYLMMYNYMTLKITIEVMIKKENFHILIYHCLHFDWLIMFHLEKI